MNSYGKGYAAGWRRSDAELAEAREQAKRAAERAELAEKGNGIVHCEECEHWLRGGGVKGASVCAWGVCEAPPGAGTPFDTWMKVEGEVGRIITTPRFGCVLGVVSPGDLT